MARRLSLGFVFMLATAFIVAACGRQVTPNPAGLGPGGAPPADERSNTTTLILLQLLELSVHDCLQHNRKRSDAID